MDYFESEPCGCQPTKPAHYLPVRVKFCPLHAQSPAMYEAAKELLECLGLQGDELAEACIAYVPEWNKLQEAVDKVKGGKQK